MEKVEDYFKKLEEMGFGRNYREGQSYVFYRVTPTDIGQDQLDRLGNTQDQYYENYAYTPPEVTQRMINNKDERNYTRTTILVSWRRCKRMPWRNVAHLSD